MDMQLKGNWNTVKGKLKEKYGQLTDDDLMLVEGKEDQLIGKLQKALGKSKDEVNDLLKRLN
jgi:uncharacterized protein YjbJ (UPF0337 family)